MECLEDKKKRAKGAPEAIIIKKMIHRSSLSGVLSNRVNRYSAAALSASTGIRTRVALVAPLGLRPA